LQKGEARWAAIQPDNVIKQMPSWKRTVKNAVSAMYLLPSTLGNYISPALKICHFYQTLESILCNYCSSNFSNVFTLVRPPLPSTIATCTDLGLHKSEWCRSIMQMNPFVCLWCLHYSQTPLRLTNVWLLDSPHNMACIHHRRTHIQK
jgi:hypothetical protein